MVYKNCYILKLKILFFLSFFCNLSISQSLNTDDLDLNTVNDINNFRKLKSTDHLSRLDSIENTISLNDIHKLEYRYESNLVYEFRTDFDNQTELWTPSWVIIWEFNDLNNLKKYTYQDWDGEYNVEGDEPNSICLFEYNSNNQLARKLRAIDPHLQQDINYETTDYFYNSNNLLEEILYSRSVFRLGDTIITKSKNIYKYDTNSQIVSDSLFRYNQELDIFENHINRFYFFNDDNLLAAATSEWGNIDGKSVPQDSIQYLYFDNDSIHRIITWDWSYTDQKLKKIEERLFSYNMYDGTAINDICILSHFNENTNQWGGKKVEEYNYCWHSGLSSLSRIKYYSANSPLSCSERSYYYNGDVLSSDILLPPNYEKLYHELHMKTLETRASYPALGNMGRASQIRYFYSKLSTEVSDISKDFNFKVFPNPFDEKLNVDLSISSKKDVNFKLFDLNGRLLYNRKILDNEEIIFSDVIAGTYMYMITIDKETFNGLLIKN